MTQPSLAEALAAGPVVLDGGLASQLSAAGNDLSDELWSARLLSDDPAAIVDAHLAFFRAGANVATTASYQATIEGFARRGHSRAEAAGLLRRSVLLARQAVGQARDAGLAQPMWIAASVGPYGAMLADGSEYRGDYGRTVAELVRFHRPRLEILADAGPDVLALETVPDTREAEALLSAIEGIGLPAWLSYSVAGGHTRAGQPLPAAFALAADGPDIIAVGVNCATPQDATQAVGIARTYAAGRPVVVYPNSGENWDPIARDWTGTASALEAPVDRWLADGARLIGGCCRVLPAQITTLAAQLGP